MTNIPAFGILQELQLRIESSDIVALKDLIDEELSRWGVYRSGSHYFQGYRGQLIDGGDASSMEYLQSGLSALEKTVNLPSSGGKILNSEIQTYISAITSKYGQEKGNP